MNTRFAIPLLCAAAIAFACGPRVHSAASQHLATVAPRKGSASKKKVVPVTKLATALDVKVGPEVQFALRVANVGEAEVELTFPSGQTHDFAVVDSSGRTLWKWSTGRLFTQSLQNRTIDPRETAEFDGEWTPPAGYHGKLVAVATMAAADHASESRTEFTLP